MRPVTRSNTAAAHPLNLAPVNDIVQQAVACAGLDPL